MPLTSDPTHNSPVAANSAQPHENSSVLKPFKPVNPPLRERKLKETTIKVTALLSAGVVCAATAVWWFLPSMLPWLK